MKKFIYILLLSFSFLIINETYAQATKLDSLENVLKNYKSEDTVKVNLLNQISFLVYQKDSSKAQIYVNQAVELSDKLTFLKGKAESLWVMGSLSAYYNSNKLALEYYLKAAKIAEEINFRPGMVKYLGSSGATYATTGNISAALECYEKALPIAEELNDKTNIARLTGRMCMIYTGKGDYKKAIEGYQKVIEICEEINDSQILSSTFNNMGSIQEYLGNYSKALEYYHKSLKVSEEANFKLGMIYSIVNIGAINATQANYKEAFDYLDRALKIAVELNDKRRISLCYEYIGDVYMKTKNAKALEYLEKALAIGEELSYTTSMLDVSRKIGEYYRLQGDYSKSLEYFKKALVLAEEMKRKRVICEIGYKMGAIHLSQKDYSKALSYTLNSLEIANEMQLLTFQRDIHNQLSEIYAATNNYTKAYINHKLFKELNDSINKEENIKKIIELEYTYKFEKEKQALELEQQKKNIVQEAEKKQQNIIILSLIGGFILMFLLAIYIYRSFRIKNKTNIILTKQKHELLQMNEEILTQRDEIETKNSKLHELNATKDKFFGIIAHDLKNPFNTILGFSNLLIDSREKYKQEESLKYIDLINSSAQNAYKLLENLLEWSLSQTQGIDFKPTHLVLENLVIENEKICEDLAKAKGISISNEIPDNLIVYADKDMLNTILRNLITNAIKYTHKGGSIRITTTIKDAKVEICISDTGIGMKEDTRNSLFKISEKTSILGTEKERGTGLGLILCKEFVNAHDGEIWVESELGKGSNFTFSIPSIQ